MGICRGGRVPVESASDRGLSLLLEPAAGRRLGCCLRGYAAGYVRKNAELTTIRAVRVHAQPAVSWLAADRPRLRGRDRKPGGLTTADHRWSFAAIYLPTIQGEETIPASAFRGLRRVRRAGAAPAAAHLTPAPKMDGDGADRGEFSRALYLHHREYNAAMGAGAIYLALVHPVACCIHAEAADCLPSAEATSRWLAAHHP